MSFFYFVLVIKWLVNVLYQTVKLVTLMVKKSQHFIFPKKVVCENNGYTLLIGNIGFHQNIQLFVLTILMKKIINYGKKCTLKWNLLPVPTIQTDKISGSSTIRVTKLPRKEPTLRYLGKDEFDDFQNVDKINNLDSLTEQHSPSGFTFKKLYDSVVYYKLCFNAISPVWF